jgi:hypothetical protein
MPLHLRDEKLQYEIGESVCNSAERVNAPGLPPPPEPQTCDGGECRPVASTECSEAEMVMIRESDEEFRKRGRFRPLFPGPNMVWPLPQRQQGAGAITLTSYAPRAQERYLRYLPTDSDQMHLRRSAALLIRWWNQRRSVDWPAGELL